MEVPRLRRPNFSYCGDHLRQDPHPSHRLVPRRLDVRHPALALQRNLDIGSYQTAWAMLARFRSVLVRPGRDRLSGTVEVDESLFGGSAEGDKGGRTPGEKALVAIAVEHNDTTRLGRARMKVIPNAKAVTLKKFLKDSVEPGSTVSTDGWPSYPGATKGVYTHKSQVIPPKQASALLPGPHRVASLAKRWILSTHQGSFRDTHLQLYLDEFVFRFNRRNSRSRGMLFYRLMELAVAHDPVSYEALLTDEADRQKARKKRKRPNPPVSRGRPPTLEQSIDNRPWRA